MIHGKSSRKGADIPMLTTYISKRRLLFLTGCSTLLLPTLMGYVSAYASDTSPSNIASFQGLNHAHERASPNTQKATHTLIIYYDANTRVNTLIATAASYGASLVYRLKIMHAIVVKVPEESITKTIEKLQHETGVLSVQRDRIEHLD